MGQSGRRRKKGRAAKSAASASVPPAAENGMKITVDIHIGGIEFLEGSTKLGVPDSSEWTCIEFNLSSEMKNRCDVHLPAFTTPREGDHKPVVGADDANGLTGGDTGPQESLRYELAWAEKAKAVEWFKAGCDQDKSAEMWFNANLTKDQRKELHLYVSAGAGCQQPCFASWPDQHLNQGHDSPYGV